MIQVYNTVDMYTFRNDFNLMILRPRLFGGQGNQY